MKYFFSTTFCLFCICCYGQKKSSEVKPDTIVRTSIRKDTIRVEQFKRENIYVTAVEAKGGILDINGYRNSDNVFVNRKVLLRKNEVFYIGEQGPKISLSLITIPFKVRRSIDTLSQKVQTGLSNAGLGINLYSYKATRYLSTGNKSTHLFSFGLLVAPTAETLTPTTTNNRVKKESQQLFISTGLYFSYTYNDLTFALIPAGIDFATTDDGKNYVYNKKRWWGLGIGISTKLIGFK